MLTRRGFVKVASSALATLVAGRRMPAAGALLPAPEPNTEAADVVVEPSDDVEAELSGFRHVVLIDAGEDLDAGTIVALDRGGRLVRATSGDDVVGVVVENTRRSCAAALAIRPTVVRVPLANDFEMGAYVRIDDRGALVRGSSCDHVGLVLDGGDRGDLGAILLRVP